MRLNDRMWVCDTASVVFIGAPFLTSAKILKGQPPTSPQQSLTLARSFVPGMYLDQKHPQRPASCFCFRWSMDADGHKELSGDSAEARNR